MATYKTIKYIVPTEVVEHTDSINALADVDTSTAAPTEGQTIKWNGTNWVPSDIEEASGLTTTLGIIIGGQYDTSFYDIGSNIYITSTGVPGSDISYTSESLYFGAAATYGGDKGFITDDNDTPGYVLLTNLGVLGSLVSHSSLGIGYNGAGLTYGGDKCIFGWHRSNNKDWTPQKSVLITNTGVVGSDTTLPTSSYRDECIGTGYGGDKGIVIFGDGYSSVNSEGFAENQTNSDGRANLISNTGIVASETACSGTKRFTGAGGEYGGDKAITYCGWGGSSWVNTINTISNTGVVSSDTTGVGSARERPSYTRFGEDKGIFYGGGNAYNEHQIYNLVSNTGVIATDTSVTNAARFGATGCGYGS